MLKKVDHMAFLSEQRNRLNVAGELIWQGTMIEISKDITIFLSAAEDRKE